MKKVYVLLMHTNTIPSKFIKLFTGYPYSHVGISLESSCEEIYSFGRKNISSFLRSGFTIEKKNGAFFEKFCQTICQIYEVDVTNTEYEKLNNILQEMVSQKEIYKYDFLGMFLRYFKIPYQKENKYVCSYFVADVLERSGILQFSKKTCFIEPRDFENIEKLNKIYEGFYSTYFVGAIRYNEKSERGSLYGKKIHETIKKSFEKSRES